MYHDKTLSAEKRAELLLSEMTLEEKLDQMVFFLNFQWLSEKLATNEKMPSRCGVGNLGTLQNLDVVDNIQKHFAENTRLGIPLLIAGEGIRGFSNPSANATVFPQCAGLGGTFNRELIYKMAQIVGKESKSIGVNQVFAPNLDIPRDPRGGRVQETYGEDPYLVGEMGVNYVKGVQENGVAATAKHLIAYGVLEGGINFSPAHVGEREIREVMLEPFKKCIDAGVMTVMPSYNEIDGVPAHASYKLLREILRNELGFDGTVICDWGAIDMFCYMQNIAETRADAGKIALRAGVDVEGPCPDGYGDGFRNAALNGDVDIALIDEAVKRILIHKFKLGLFDNPYSNKEYRKELHSKEAKELALLLDEQSILLLKNDGILPLDKNKIGKVAVIGNNAKDSFLGNYIYPTDNCISFYDGIVERLGTDRVLYSKGCNHITYTDDMIRDAVDTAKKSDVVFLVLGDSCEMGGGNVGGAEFSGNEVTCDEGYDTHTLNFTPSQQKLFDEITKLHKPTVLILYGGRPYAIKDEVKNVNAFMFSFGGGEQSGVAFANLLFGDKSPSAKLSVSFPQSVGHIPCYYNHKVSARGSYYKMPGSPEKPGRDYIFASPSAWLPFGYGLSYTTVEYSDLAAAVLENGNVKVTVTVKNTGKYEIDESVLLYVKMLCCPITPFVRKLRNFKKVNLKPGDTKTVEFILTDEDFTYIDENMKTAKNVGKHKIIIENLEYEITI